MFWNSSSALRMCSGVTPSFSPTVTAASGSLACYLRRDSVPPPAFDTGELDCGGKRGAWAGP